MTAQFDDTAQLQVYDAATGRDASGTPAEVIEQLWIPRYTEMPRPLQTAARRELSADLYRFLLAAKPVSGYEPTPTITESWPDYSIYSEYAARGEEYLPIVYGSSSSILQTLARLDGVRIYWAVGRQFFGKPVPTAHLWAHKQARETYAITGLDGAVHLGDLHAAVELCDPDPRDGETVTDRRKRVVSRRAHEAQQLLLRDRFGEGYAAHITQIATARQQALLRGQAVSGVEVWPEELGPLVIPFPHGRRWKRPAGRVLVCGWQEPGDAIRSLVGLSIATEGRVGVRGVEALGARVASPYGVSGWPFEKG